VSDFAPGIESMRSAGIPVTIAPYAEGSAGIRQSLDAMALKMREGRIDTAVIGHTGKVLQAAGLDGRSGATTDAKRVAALLDDLRATTVYAPDAYGAEVIQSASGTMCLRPGLCLMRGDCIPEGTLLLRDDFALVPIEQIKAGDRIWGHDKWSRVEAVAFKGKLTVDAIEMNNGSTMHLTGEHKVFVGRCRHGRGAGCQNCSGSQRCMTFERIAVADLQEGEPLLQPERISFGTLERDLGREYIAGLYLSEGWSEENRFAISGQDGCRKEALKHEVKSICERLDVPTYWHKKYIRVNDAAWAADLARLGGKARFKHAETLNLTKAPAEQLLRGIMSDSTSNTNGPGRTFSTTSRTLMIQARVLHRMFGTSTSVRMLTPEQHGGAGKHNLWRVGVRVAEKTLAVKSIERAVRDVPCWDVQTDDHYVYLPEHDVTVSNCDDLSVALGSMTLSLGIPTQIVKQSFGANQQEHVLIAVFVDGDWKYADPSTNMPFGQAPNAQSEMWVDPMEAVGNVPEASPQIVTLGRPSIGVGTWLGYPTVQDLVDLTNAIAYDLQQIQAAWAKCPNGFTDQAEWAAWKTDFAACAAYIDEVVRVVNAETTASHWPKFTVVDSGTWDLVRHARDLEIDLDRRWRQFGGNCTAPVYPDEPQPTSDPDLAALQAADVVTSGVDSALKRIKAAADNAAKPITIGIAGIGIGIVVALGAVIAIDHLLPSRR
jgi:hypothetical protein